ncbi:hypothetical protein LEP1GSC188_1416 [Leptospira weilii serovar Topaz str. LT2116]|uniref:Uncharacterized protein n=1 Tax=Leptospira weilii serovar Topaz str. LT2116 TaxID=1088540 RepID=M3GCT5_9LEPT|nr:hypothetical protein LEP1GSC188_1416 [Leptospira weilii serovar Topaz str. LT2116]
MVVRILEKEFKKPYASWSELDPYELINAVMRLYETGRIPKSESFRTPREITRILKSIDKVFKTETTTGEKQGNERR